MISTGAFSQKLESRYLACLAALDVSSDGKFIESFRMVSIFIVDQGFSIFSIVIPAFFGIFISIDLSSIKLISDLFDFEAFLFRKNKRQLSGGIDHEKFSTF